MENLLITLIGIFETIAMMGLSTVAGTALGFIIIHWCV